MKNKLDFFVLSSKPYRRRIFLSLQNLQKGSKFLFYKGFVFKVSFFSNHGSFNLYFFTKNIIIDDMGQKFSLFNIYFFFSEHMFTVFKTILSQALSGIQFCWMTIFGIEGYHFRTEYFFIRSLRQYAILFKLGFFYDLLIVFPRTFKIYSEKRLFKLRSSNLLDLYNLSFYIRMLRNLFPYKVKGIIYDNYNYNRTDYEKAIYTFKQGKKAKLR